MDAEFWLDRWAKGRTGWQRDAPDPMFLRHFGALGLVPGARVLVPLCGATPDIGWLLAQGFGVVGAELSGVAIGRLFEELGVVAEVTEEGPMRRHRARRVDILEGDIFDLTPAIVGPIDAIHDRAALFALPPDIRRRYVAHLVALTGGAPQVLTCLDYGGAPDEGPPFSVTADEVEALYAPHYSTSLLEEVVTALPSGDRDVDSLWLMARR